MNTEYEFENAHQEKLYSIMPFSLFKSTYSYLDHLLLFKFYKMNGSDLIFETQNGHVLKG